MKKKIAIILTFVLVVVLFCGCDISDVTYGVAENTTSSSMTASYKNLNDSRKTTLTVKKDEEKTLKVEIETKKGQLDLTITDEDGTAVYEGEDLETSTFDVVLDKEGKYTIKFEGKKHSGSFKVNW